MTRVAGASAVPEAYAKSRRYDQAVIQHQRADPVVPCPLQPRDVALIDDVREYKFLTGDQLHELWWPNCGPRAAQRRLRKLHQAGYLDRFRPLAQRGSFPWTYQLAPGGHRLLQAAGHVQPRQRFNQREIYDYSYVVHDLQLNSWVLAYRRILRERLISWEGETDIVPPPGLDFARQGIPDYWRAEDLIDERPRTVRPDALLTVLSGDGGDVERLMFVEYDRTRRVDKNFEKFRRYDNFLTWWWHHSEFRDRHEPPFVLFVCQTAEQRNQFVRAADTHLTGNHWRIDVRPERQPHPGRGQMLFALEADMYSGDRDALRVPEFPPRHPHRAEIFRRVRLPGGPPAEAAQRDADDPA